MKLLTIEAKLQTFRSISKKTENFIPDFILCGISIRLKLEKYDILKWELVKALERTNMFEFCN